jgi:nicotinamide riboside kinase
MTYKRNIVLLVVGVLLFCGTMSAGWWKTYGGAGNELGNCVQITSDGNYIISGSKDLNLWLLKVDTSGNVIWEHTYGRSDTWLWRWIEETNDGGYIVAPRTPSLLKISPQGDSLWAKDYGINSHCVQQTSDGGYVFTGDYAELVLTKTDSNGDSLWTQRHKNPGNDYNVGYFIQEANDMGFIITGQTDYVDSEGYGWTNLWLIKTDSLGSLLWSRVYGEQVYDYISKGYCVRETSDSGYIVSGVSPEGLWLLKTDSLGDTLWTKTYSYSGGTGFSVRQTHDGGYILTGVSKTFTTSLNAEAAKLWLLKTDSIGDTLWTRLYSGEGYDVGRCVQQTSDLGYIITGYTSSHGAGGSDIYLLKTDSLGLLAINEESLAGVSTNWQIASTVGRQITLYYSDSPQGFHGSVFDAIGRKVDELHSSSQSGTIIWGGGYNAGVYFIKENEINNAQTERVVLVHQLRRKR